jgi:hypothetical protein
MLLFGQDACILAPSCRTLQAPFCRMPFGSFVQDAVSSFVRSVTILCSIVAVFGAKLC